MELTDSEWLRELAKQLEEAERGDRGVIEISSEMADWIAEKARSIALHIDKLEQQLQ